MIKLFKRIKRVVLLLEKVRNQNSPAFHKNFSKLGPVGKTVVTIHIDGRNLVKCSKDIQLVAAHHTNDT